MRLIDADALKEKIVDNSYLITYDYEFKSFESGMSLTGIQQAIDEMPTVEAIPKVTDERTRGKWILPNDCVARYLDEWICSNCSHLISHRHNFCPNCGAYMLGGRRNETD